MWRTHAVRTRALSVWSKHFFLLMKITGQQTTISRIHEEIQGVRRTVVGCGLSLARLKNEMDTRKRANKGLEYRNHSLRQELRRGGHRL